VDFVPGPVSASASTVVATPPAVVANGTTSSTVTVTVADANQNPISGQTVTLEAANGSSIITTVAGTTNASGVASFTVLDNTPETVTYSAQDISGTAVTLSQTAAVDFTADPTSPSLSSVTASPSFVPADGVSSSTIIVTLEDASGRPIVGHTVVLGASGGGSSVVAPASATTNSNGVATFSVTDSQRDGEVVFTAKDTTSSVTVNQTARVDFA
jgi:hypothetical protein